MSPILEAYKQIQTLKTKWGNMDDNIWCCESEKEGYFEFKFSSRIYNRFLQLSQIIVRKMLSTTLYYLNKYFRSKIIAFTQNIFQSVCPPYSKILLEFANIPKYCWNHQIDTLIKYVLAIEKAEIFLCYLLQQNNFQSLINWHSTVQQKQSWSWWSEGRNLIPLVRCVKYIG